jgi:hypothetical protein
MKDNHNLVTNMFFGLFYFICFWLYNEGSKPFCFHHADRGTSLLAEVLILGCRGNAHAGTEREVVAGGLREVERNL